VGIHHADTRGERIDLALQLATHGLDVHALLVQRARQLLVPERPGDVTTNLQARPENQGNGQQRDAEDPEKDPAPRQIELPNLSGLAEDNAEFHRGAKPVAADDKNRRARSSGRHRSMIQAGRFT
jgi:hypothetical protein